MNKQDVENELERLTSKGDDTFIIEYKGSPLKMSSGKSSWNTIGAAKNAFNNCVYGAVRRLGFKNSAEMREYCETEGLIKYRKL